MKTRGSFCPCLPPNCADRNLGLLVHVYVQQKLCASLTVKLVILANEETHTVMLKRMKMRPSLGQIRHNQRDERNPSSVAALTITCNCQTLLK